MWTTVAFPDSFGLNGVALPIDYQFDPGKKTERRDVKSPCWIIKDR